MTLEERKAFFEEEGYLIAEGLLSADELEECRQEVDRLHLLAAELKAKGDPRGGSFQQEPYAKDAKREDGSPVLRKIENTRAHSDVFRRLSEHPNVLREVKNLLGPDLLLFRSTLMLKPARHGSPHGFHQDSAYWPMEPPALVTVSIALNDSTLENGCIRVIPKSHLWGEKLGGRIAREQHESLTDGDEIDEADAVAAPLKAGGGLFFHSLCAHGSGPNRSPRPRNTALYAYFSPEVRYTAKSGSRTFPVVAGLNGATEKTLHASG
ncbi:MAG: phytanoyl-CoA dioxygenase family protein [Candidatus Poribacteria bacterium]|nr:phytanoyl-CoA dioxygenase family protein [Candidatus Poribacteria bacterium]